MAGYCMSVQPYYHEPQVRMGRISWAAFLGLYFHEPQ